MIVIKQRFGFKKTLALPMQQLTLWEEPDAYVVEQRVFTLQNANLPNHYDKRSYPKTDADLEIVMKEYDEWLRLYETLIPYDTD